MTNRHLTLPRRKAQNPIINVYQVDDPFVWIGVEMRLAQKRQVRRMTRLFRALGLRS